MDSITISSIDDFVKIENIHSIKPGEFVRVYVSFDNYSREIVSRLRDFAIQAKQKGCELDILISAKEMEFQLSEMEQFVELEDVFISNDIGFYFRSSNSEHSLNDALNAQAQIDELIEKINNTQASPFEKYLMAYNYVASRVYKENEQNKSSSRELISILNSDDIVCVGYASLMNRICKGIGIKSYSQSSDVYDEKGNLLGDHANNIVYIKDEKYGIDGYYYSDSCWDSVNKPEQYKRLMNMCLIPLSDKDKLKWNKVSIADEFIEGVSLKCFTMSKLITMKV